MYSVSKTFSFCYGHRLLDDKGKCRHLHGHTAKVTLFLRCDVLDQNGMVIHFDTLKNSMGRWISETLDHSLLLSEKDPLAKMLDASNERYIKVPFNPTAENISKMIFDKAISEGLPVVRVDVWESETSRAGFEKN